MKYFVLDNSQGVIKPQALTREWVASQNVSSQRYELFAEYPIKWEQDGTGFKISQMAQMPAAQHIASNGGKLVGRFADLVTPVKPLNIAPEPEPVPEPDPQPADQEQNQAATGPDLEDMKRAELAQLAKDLGISAGSKTKQVLIDEIRENQ